MEGEKLCRLCAQDRENFVKIYEQEGQSLNLATKIIQCLQIWLYPEDPLPKAVCIDCCSKLNQYFEFFETSSKAQRSLQLMFDEKVAKKELKNEVLEMESTTISASAAATAVSATVAPDLSSKLDLATDYFEKEEDDDAGPLAALDNDIEDDSTNDCDGEGGEVPDYVECVLSDKEVNVNPQRPGTSRRKCRVPVKRTAGGVVKNTRAPPKERTRAKKEPVVFKCERLPTKRIAKLKAEQKVKEVKEREKEERKRPGRKRKEPKALPAKAKPKAVLEGYPWVCTDCDETLPTLPSLRQHHTNVHNQIPNFKCIQCAKTYTRYRSFARHVKLHRNPKKFKCEECGKCFSQKTVLQSHSTVHTDARPHICPQCGKAFKQFSSLYLHSKCHLPDQVKPKFPCDVCHKDFATKHTLETHRKIHTGERNFICDVCGKSFIAKGSLDYHILTHSGEKPHACPVCGKGFKTARLLGKHATLHTGIKPHQCDVCGKQFRERGALREHNRIHTGAMPYSCEFCGKNFRFKGILTVHRRQHTGERPYGCLECRREFTNWANYNKHMKRRHRSNDPNDPRGYRPVPTHTGGTPAHGSVPPKIIGPNACPHTAPETPPANPQPISIVTSNSNHGTAVFNLSNNSTGVGDNSNSSTISNMTVVTHNPQAYNQTHQITTAVAKMAAANIYNSHMGSNNATAKMTVFHGGNHGGKMATITNVFHHQQDSQDSNQSVNANALMGSYHVPAYVPAGLPMGSMGYYIPPIHHTDPNMEMLQHRMTNNQ